MNPSSLSTWATFTFSRLAGISTAGRSIRLAFRRRVSMSASGSVIMDRVPLPAGLLDAWDEAVAGHVTEADAADAKLAVDSPRPAAQPAAQANADALTRQHLNLGIGLFAGFQLGRLLLEFDVLRFGGHGRQLRLAEGHAEAAEQFPGLVIAVGARDKGDVHA